MPARGHKAAAARVAAAAHDVVQKLFGRVVRRIGQLKEGEDVVGQRVRAKVVKNKVAPPFRVAEFDMMHTDGISYEGDILDMGMEEKIIGRTGAWFRYGEMQLGQGKEKARLFLKENPKIAEEIKQKIMASGGHASLSKPSDSSSDTDASANGEE